MPTILFHDRGDVFSGEVKDNTNLVVRAGIKQFPYPHLRYGCGMGKCAKCACRVIAGAEHLAAPNWKEKKQLGELLDEGYRLMCQLWIQHDIELEQDDRALEEECGRSGTRAMTSYVILTGKPGLFRTEPSPDLRPVERYDYVFFGRTRARFVIAELERETRIVVIDEALPPTVNSLPSRLLKKYASIDAARRDLEQLVKPDSTGAALNRVTE